MFILILIRFLKDKKLFHLIQNHYSIEKINKLISIHLDKYQELTLKSLFISNIPFLEFLLSTRGMKTIREFNLLFFTYVQPLIDDFIKQEQLTEIIQYELQNNEYKIHQAQTLNEYYNLFRECKNSPSHFFSHMFSWAQTRQGHSYWETINTKFQSYLNNLLIQHK